VQQAHGLGAAEEGHERQVPDVAVRVDHSEDDRRPAIAGRRIGGDPAFELPAPPVDQQAVRGGWPAEPAGRDRSPVRANSIATDRKIRYA
jgi:hypothetical protein